MDCTGGQCATKDGDLADFGKHVVDAARNGGVKL